MTMIGIVINWSQLFNFAEIMGYDLKHNINPLMRTKELKILQGLVDVTTLNHPLCVWSHRITKSWNNSAWRRKAISTNICDYEREGFEIQLQLFKFMQVNSITKELDMAEFTKHPSSINTYALKYITVKSPWEYILPGEIL